MPVSHCCRFSTLSSSWWCRGWQQQSLDVTAPLTPDYRQLVFLQLRGHHLKVKEGLLIWNVLMLQNVFWPSPSQMYRKMQEVCGSSTCLFLSLLLSLPSGCHLAAFSPWLLPPRLSDFSVCSGSFCSIFRELKMLVLGLTFWGVIDVVLEGEKLFCWAAGLTRWGVAAFGEPECFPWVAAVRPSPASSCSFGFWGCSSADLPCLWLIYVDVCGLWFRHK